jgi:hypothetical protein
MCYGAAFTCPLCAWPVVPIEALRRAALVRVSLLWEARPLLDLLVLALGTGGILLMGAYAALCDRI